MLDNSDFADTDIPFEVPVPDKQHLPVSLFTATWSNDVMEITGRVDNSNFSIDLHPSKPLISLVPITCTTYCSQ